MRNGSLFLFSVMATALLIWGATTARAQDEIPLEFGTYSQSKEWCQINRADKDSPDYKGKRAYINLSATEINWNQDVGRIGNVSIDGKKINLAGDLTSNGTTQAKTLTLFRKDKKIFAIFGVNFYRCSTYMPNPWLGH